MPPKRNQNRSKSHSKNGKQAAEINAMAECILPRDMMIAILARLPVKSLVRFKCVCKPWRSLIANPDFIRIHTSHGPRASTVQSHFLTCPILGVEPNKVAPVDLDAPYDIFFDHCNGLVCLGRPSFTDKVILWNPATNMWKVLPDSRANFGAVNIVSLGFGCNAEGDDFKVVRIYCLKGKKMKVGVEVYSSKSGSWRIIDDVGFRFRLMYPKNHVIANGNPYWLACFAERLNEIGEIEEATALLGFDSTNMKFMVQPFPGSDVLGEPGEGEEGVPFVNWKGSVAALLSVKKDGDWLKGIDVWCYGSDGEWSRKERFEIPLGLEVDQCLDCSSSGKIIGGCTNGKLFVFDPETGSVVVSEMRKGKGRSFQIFAYEESLAYVKDMTPAGVSHREEKAEFNDIGGFFVASLRHKTGQVTCYYAMAS